MIQKIYLIYTATSVRIGCCTRAASVLYICVIVCVYGVRCTCYKNKFNKSFGHKINLSLCAVFFVVFSYICSACRCCCRYYCWYYYYFILIMLNCWCKFEITLHLSLAAIFVRKHAKRTNIKSSYTTHSTQSRFSALQTSHCIDY